LIGGMASRKRARAAPTALDGRFRAVDGSVTLLAKRAVPATLRIVSLIAASALRAAGDVGAPLDEEALVALVCASGGTLVVAPAAPGGGGGPLVVSQAAPGGGARGAASRLRAFRAAAAELERGSRDTADGGLAGGGGDGGGGASVAGSSFVDDASSIGGAFPEELAEAWLAAATADLALALDAPQLGQGSDGGAAARPAGGAPSPLAASLLQVTTRGLASRCGGSWPAVQRRVDDGYGGKAAAVRAEL